MTDNLEAQSFLEKLRATKPPVIELETEAFGKVYVRKLNGADQTRLHDLSRELDLKQKAFPPAAMLAVWLVNSDGTPLFPDAMEGFRELSQAGAEELAEISKLALRAFGLGKDSLEDAEKKSSSSQS